MTPSRMSIVLSCQTIQAKKVFAALEVDQSMSIHQIRTVMIARGRNMAHNVIEGCLHSLCHVGLVVNEGGRFRAIFDASQPHTPTPAAEQDATSMTTSVEVTIHQSTSISVSAPAGAHAAPAAGEADTLQAATNRIAAIGTEVVEVVEGVRQQLGRLTALGAELDELAILITLETDHVNEQIEKLGKVQALLRDLGVAA